MRVVSGWFWWEEFGDRCDGAEDLVVNQFFDKHWLLDGVGVGFCVGCVRAGFGGKERGDDLQVVEHLAGAVYVEVV